MKQRINPDGATNSWTYYLDGRMRREFLSNGNYWETTYDDVNRLVKRTFSADSSNTETKVFDRRGNLVITTNVVGAVFTNSYDGLNRINVAAGPPGLAGYSVQQFTTNVYDDSGKIVTAFNGLGERTVTTLDALQRPVSVEVRAPNNDLVNKTTTIYAGDHHSLTVVEGTGASAITTTTFADTFGKPVLTQHFPGGSAMEFTLNSYDILGNLIASRDELNRVTTYTYDPLNRVTTNTLPDGAQTVLGYNAAGAITTRLMPGGLTWSATYDDANRILSEKLVGGAQTTRTNAYEYYTGGAFAGLLRTVTDARGVVVSNTYDSLLRLVGVDSHGSLPEHRLHKQIEYDNRGLAFLIDHYADDASVLTPTAIWREFDGYGQIVEELGDLNGYIEVDLIQQWNSAGRRTQLQRGIYVNAQGQGASGAMSFGYRADGVLTNVTSGGQGYSFGYGDNGLLASRSTPFRTVTVNQRDGRGRMLQLTTMVGAATPLVETLHWRADSTIDDYTATRSTFTDARAYSYNVRGQLTNETLAVGSGQTVNQAYQFDSDKLGVLVSATQTGARTNRWQGRLDTFKRVDAETNVLNQLALRANGTALGAASVDAKLDGGSVGVNFTAPDGRWSSDLDLGVGSHALAATAHHPLGAYHPSTTNTFTVSGTNDVATVYDSAGNVISRTFPSGRVQTFTWDGFGRLLKRAEKTGSTTNWIWSAAYDGLGRRVRTVFTPATNGVPDTQQSTTIDSWYDPQVEFLEVAVEVNGQRTWKVYGPDLTGSYGEMQGIGGTEATIRETDDAREGLLTDYFGNALATIANGQVNWSASRFDGYGPVQGNQAVLLSSSVTVAQALGWQGRWADLTGDVNMGVRVYSFQMRRFYSCDPMGHATDWGLYNYTRGNPIVDYDPSGRNPVDQIGGFTYDASSGGVRINYASPGFPPQTFWRYNSQSTSFLWFANGGTTRYPFDFDWRAEQTVESLRKINQDYREMVTSYYRSHPEAMPHVDNDSIRSADMEIVDVATLFSGVRLARGLTESLSGSASRNFAFRTGAEGEAFVREMVGGSKQRLPIRTEVDPDLKPLSAENKV